jgi:hypothetical protein
MENVLRRPPHTRVCLAVPRVKCIRNHERYERISELTAAAKGVANDPLRMYIALRLRSMGCGGMQNIYKSVIWAM